MRILIVDDEQELCEILQYTLESEGYEVSTALSAEEALGMDLSVFDLFLLDVMLGEMSGFRLAQLLKASASTAAIPIIFITALDGEESIVGGFNLGADDYITKPLSLRQVKARVRAVLRRCEAVDNGGGERIEYGALCLIPAEKRATLGGTALHLTRLEYELLALLLQNRGKIFSREQLLRECWPADTIVIPRTVDVNIARLRRKLGAYGKQIKARIGYGYAFVDK